MRLVIVLCLTSLLSGCTTSAATVRWSLLLVFAMLTLIFSVILLKELRRRKSQQASLRWRPNGKELTTGFITDFFDTLGIGSFASSTALFRFWRLVPDENLPGTLNIAHTLPTIAQALIFIEMVPVEPVTLTAMILAAGIGAWWGSGIVCHLPKRYIQISMSLALLAAATLMLLSMLKILPSGGTQLELSGLALCIATVGNFVLGILMTVGIGLYAPCMILISLLGMSPLAAFPIMMGSCAFLMPLSSIRFARSDRWQPSVVIGIIFAGIPAVLLAAFVVKSLPLDLLRWLVVMVVLYVAIGLWRDGKARQQMN